MVDNEPPPWDQEATLAEARAQVARRVDRQAAERGVAARWLSDSDVRTELAAIEEAGSGVVVGTDFRLWRWPAPMLVRLSEQIRLQDGLLVFIEPTAGLGLRRLGQLLFRCYRRDLPADLRAAGLIVTTQVRLRDGIVGTFVRGEARHFD